jgi:hypothetical protein
LTPNIITIPSNAYQRKQTTIMDYLREVQKLAARISEYSRQARTYSVAEEILDSLCDLRKYNDEITANLNKISRKNGSSKLTHA